MAAPNTSDLPKKKSRARKPNISTARKKKDNGRNVEVSMRTFEENIRENGNKTGEKNPIIGEIMYTFKDKNVPNSDDVTDIETALETVKEFINVCTVSVTARLVTDEDNILDESPKPPRKPKRKKSIEQKVPKKDLCTIEKKVESSPVVSDVICSNNFVSSCSQQVCEDINASELKTLDSQEVPVVPINVDVRVVEEPIEAGEFDLLSTRPRKKRISFYSQHKKAYSSKYPTNGDAINKKEMTMHDLIFYNPTNNPMSNSQEPAKKNTGHIEEVSDLMTDKLEEEMVDDVEEENSEVLVPQLKLSADGKIILDPKSLVVQTSAEKSLKALENSAIIEENGKTLNPFTKVKKRYHFWTPLETLRFYRALNAIGTDFSLMQTVFPNRTRYDLKKKFKKEERTNRELIDKALAAAAEFDVNMLEEDIKKDMARAEIQRKAKEEMERKKKEEKEDIKLKKKLSRRKPMRNLLDDDTGNYEKGSPAAYTHPPTRRKKVTQECAKVKGSKRLKLPGSDTSDEDEDEPQFDSLYPSDDDQILHTDHTYVKRLEYSQRKMIKYGDHGSDTESGHEEEEEKNEDEQSITRTENGHVHEVDVPVNENHSTHKSIPLYGNELIGINHESESGNDTRNEEKENENLNVNDTISLTEYVIISENLAGYDCKPVSFS